MNSKSFFHYTSLEFSQRGIFFRFPFQKVIYSYYDFDGNNDTFTWRLRAKKFIFPIIYNWKVFFKLPKWEEEDNFTGCSVLELCFPIYFKRNARTANIIFKDNPLVKTIKVYGWEPYKNNCAGAAEKEITYITYTDGSKKKIITKEYFKYYYSHIIKKLFNAVQL